MALRSRLREGLRRDRYLILLMGITLAVVYWFADAAAYAYLLDEGDFWRQMFSPEAGQLAVRVSIAVLLILLALYAQLGLRSRGRETEDALRDSENQYRNLVDSAMDIILTLSEDGKVGSLNPAFEAVTGWARAELIGKEFIPLVHPDDAPLVVETHRRVLRREHLPARELRILTKTGEYIVAELELSPQVQDERVIGVLGIARDITERKRAEVLLQISHNFLQIANRHMEMVPLLEECVAQIKTFTGCSSVGVRILDNDGAIPYEAQEGFSQEFVDAENGVPIESERHMCSKVIKGLVDQRLPLFTETGSFWTNGTTRSLIRIPEAMLKENCGMCNEFGFESVALVPVRVGGRVAGLIHVADPSEDVLPLEMVEVLEQVAIQLGMVLQRVRAEDAMRESEKRYRLLAENASDVIWTMNMYLKFTYYSPAVMQLRGFTVGEAMAQTLEQTLSPASVAVALDVIGEEMSLDYAELKGRSTSRVLQLEVTRKDGSTVWTEVTMTFLRDSEGEPVEILGVTRDITERKKIEQMKSDFVSLVSHQLKTPEGMITGYVDCMLEGLTGELTLEQREQLEEIREISQSNYRLIADLLNVSRIERGVISVQLETASLAEIVDVSLRDYREKIVSKGLVLEVEGLDDNIIVHADKMKMVQALSNLINNAIKFTSEGSISIKVQCEGGFAVVEVSDTGIGMTEDVLKDLFNKDRVLSTSPSPEESAGLGLYICKEFMALQNGDVYATSTVGKGTTFYVKVPLVSGGDCQEATTW